ncbi:hypothetical protein Syun_004395 [Stephania yunnanensis]|uniref:Uncharacterized protein n=1 Tax=Stephania yunnanensis TaxID=152371 RepID=A0AAP0Q161_9MAGN
MKGFFQLIRAQCSGLVQIAKHTLGKCMLRGAWLQVRGDKHTFFLSVVMVPYWSLNVYIRISCSREEDDDVAISRGYDKAEKLDNQMVDQVEGVRFGLLPTKIVAALVLNTKKEGCTVIMAGTLREKEGA